MSGYVKIGDKCGRCPADSTYNGSDCVCTGGAVAVDGVCKKCGLNEVVNGSDCVCK